MELGSGQSFMIAGLLSNYSQNSIDKAPGLGDVPVLGNLFRSTEFRKGQTELVIVVTPYLVNPVNDRDIKLPTDGYHSPNFFEQLSGLESKGVDGEERPGPRSSDEQAPDPKISFDDTVATKPRQAAADSAAAAPGFSLK